MPKRTEVTLGQFSAQRMDTPSNSRVNFVEMVISNGRESGCLTIGEGKTKREALERALKIIDSCGDQLIHELHLLDQKKLMLSLKNAEKQKVPGIGKVYPCQKCGQLPMWGAGYLLCENDCYESECTENGNEAVVDWNRENTPPKKKKSK